jgi:hypothetical protein
LFVVVSQTGVAPEHVELSVHCTHAPVLEHAGFVASTAAHWEAVVQPVHVLVTVAQIGVAPEQLAPVRHCTHLFVVVSQMGVVPEQVELSVHWTHPPVGEHTDRVASMVAHWVEVVHAVQVPLALVQTGAVAGHVAPVRHPTQVPVIEQSVRAGSLSVAHCGDVLQAAQAPAAQIGVAAGQVALARHCTHAPVAAHTVRPGSASVAHWPEVAQAPQVPAAEQIGVAAGQVALV